jgi:succinate-semialdehyde dehydrogenase/glutarate-semialdehyde dehydrogenase
MASNTKVGDGLGPDTRMGPLANPRRVNAVETFVNDAQEKGAKVATGGKRIGNQGNFFQPTVLTDVPESARIMNEEPFGPVAVMLRFKETDEMLTRANKLRPTVSPATPSPRTPRLRPRWRTRWNRAW